MSVAQFADQFSTHGKQQLPVVDQDKIVTGSFVFAELYTHFGNKFTIILVNMSYRIPNKTIFIFLSSFVPLAGDSEWK
jgi:hypothetical protein